MTIPLTPSQIQAIQKTQGPCLILAGAGTGKTHTIVEKVKHLIQNSLVSAEKLVVITFSNEAANSLQTRIQKSLPENSKQPVIKTFHAFSADLIKQHENANFQILTPDEAKIILHRNFKIPAMNCHRYIASIGNAKDLGITIPQLESYLKNKLAQYQDIDINKRLESLQFELQTLYLKKDKDKHSLSAEIKKISDILKLQKFIKAWNAYEKLKRAKNLQDYSDLNTNALALLRKKPELADSYNYIIVDEFQDTNKIQIDLLKFLAPNKNITVVGDINQSIYRFRGAYNKNLEEFKTHFQLKKEDIFNLDKSHRSTNKILQSAHQLILNNYKNPSDCFEVKNAYNIQGENLKIFELNDQKEETRKVIELIKAEQAKGTPLENICIMFRNHQYGRIIKRSLEFESIQFTSVTKSSLLEQNSLKTIISYLTILDKLKRKAPGGEQAWWNLIYYLNLRESDLIKVGKFIKQNAKEENLSVKLLNELPKLELESKDNLAIRVVIEKIKRMLLSLDKPLTELLKDVFHFSGVVNEQTKKQKEVHLNLNKFYELAQTHSGLYEPDLESFLHHLDIIKALKIEIPSPEIEEAGVRLMTLHSTKGLEYPIVILTNMAQKRFPMEKFTNNSLIPLELILEVENSDKTGRWDDSNANNLSSQSAGGRAGHIPTSETSSKFAGEDTEYLAHEYERRQQLSEERRLCYVAFTRAKNSLILTYAKEYNKKVHHPSQFLQEINYKQNPDISFFIDSQQKFIEPEVKITPASTIVQTNLDGGIKIEEEREPIFSPSSLLTFSDCQKKYEYKYIYNMPEERPQNWEVMRLGSFVHHVLENGVKLNLQSLKEFIDLAKQEKLKDDWESIDLEEAEHLIKVFHARNKDKFNANSKTEQNLKAEFEGIKFQGFADRIDFNPEGMEIIDYKTGNSNVLPKNRNWQLGLYALAAQKLGKVNKITLDMLRHEKPLEFTLDEQGNAKSEYGRMEFNINEIKTELVEEAKKVLEAMKTGFKPCPVEKNCDFCNEYFYNGR